MTTDNTANEISQRPSDVDDELLSDFQEEAAEHIANIETLLLRLEKTPEDKELVHEIFRPIHSIKGGANYLGLIYTATLAHSIENMLAKIRKGEMRIDARIIGILLAGADFIKRLLNEIKKQGWEASPTRHLVAQVERIIMGQVVDSEDSQPPIVGEPIATQAKEDWTEFLQCYNDVTERITDCLAQLMAEPGQSQNASTLAADFQMVQQRASLCGFTRIVEVAEFSRQLCIGLQQGRIKALGYALDVLSRAINFLDDLVAKILEEGNDNVDLRPIIHAFAMVKYSDADVYDPQSEFQEEAGQYLEDIDKSLKVLLGKGYRLDLYEDIVGCFTSLKGYCHKINYGDLAKLMTADEQLANMLLLGELQLFPRVYQLFADSLELLGKSLRPDEHRKLMPQVTKISTTILQLLDKRHKMREKQFDKRLIRQVYKVVQNFYKVLELLKQKKQRKYLDSLKKTGESFTQYLITYDVEYYLDAVHFLLDKVYALEDGTAKFSTNTLAILHGTIQELEEMVFMADRDNFANQKGLREKWPLKKRLAHVPGMNTTMIANLLKQYSTTESLQQATIESLVQVPSIDPIVASYLVMEFGEPREASAQADDLKRKIDMAIAGRQQLRDPDYDSQLIEIFVDNARRILHRLAESLGDYENNPSSDIGAITSLLKSLRTSAHYMDYPSLVTILDQTLASISQKEGMSDPVLQLSIILLEIAGALPLSQPELAPGPKFQETLPPSPPLPAWSEILAAPEIADQAQPEKMGVDAIEAFGEADPVAPTKGEAMEFTDKPEIPEEESARQEEEILHIFIANAEEDIEALREYKKLLQPGQADEEVLREIYNIIKNLEATSNQLDFQDLSLFLMKELNNIEELLQGQPFTNQRIQHLNETIANFVDFIRELKGEEVEPELPSGYFEGDSEGLTPTMFSDHAPEIPRAMAEKTAESAEMPQIDSEQSLPQEPASQLEADEMLPLAMRPAATVESDAKVLLADDWPDEAISQDPQEISLEEPQRIEPYEPTTEQFSTVKEDMQAHTLRVNSMKVDDLMNLVGELVVNRSSFEMLSQDIKNLYRQFLMAGIFSKEQAREFKGLIVRMDLSSSEMGRIANELQGGVMQVRMVPMDVLFKRLPRIVRELSKKMGKLIKLDIYGETTELDKIVIEEITDPLVHIIRNMVDHGIETPEQRKGKKKPPYGTIEISAYHEGNQVVIEIIDDGQGIDGELVRQRIVELGLIPDLEAKRMSEHELIKMIYHPGFSTRKSTDMTSGRGVGMNVIKNNLAKIGGNIEIDTEVGVYTCFIIKIPLTLAIIQALLVKVGGAIYSIPISSVREVVRLRQHDIHTLEGQNVIRIRGRLVPLFDLRQVFNLPVVADEEMRFVIVGHTGHRESGLLVNSLLGGHDIVIKSLSDDMVITPGISGATLLGDGTVSLILDIPGITNFAYSRKSRSLAAK